MESGPAAKAGQSSNLGAERSDAARADGAPRMTAKDHAKGHKRAPHHQSSKRPKRVASEQPGGSGGCQNKSNRCNTLIVVTDLADGPHSLAVRAKDDAGNVDPTPATYSWTVDMTAATTSAAPTNAGSRTVSDKSSGSAITDRELEDKSTGVATTATIEVTFAEAIDPTSLTTATFTLQQPDGQPVAATVTYDAASQTATLDPKTSLAPKTPYVAMLKGGAGGIATASGPVFPSDITWSFTTVSQVKHAKSRKSSQARIATTATTSTFTFAPEADARVESANPTTNFGSSNNLIVDTSPQTESDLRFAASGVGSGAVGQALLRVHTTSYSGAGTNIGPAVYPLADNSWDESSVTWNTKPAPSGGAIANVGAIAANTWVEYDVTSLVTGDGTYSFDLVPKSADAAYFYSKEEVTNAAFQPATRADAQQRSDRHNHRHLSGESNQPTNGHLRLLGQSVGRDLRVRP